MAVGYYDSPWPCEDGGPDRRQRPVRPFASPLAGRAVTVTTRIAPVVTMAVTRDPGELFLLRHGVGDGATSLVEQIDPVTLEPLRSSVELAGGPGWPGSIAVHASGDLYVVFGRYAHRLRPDLSVVASRRLPRDLPYNGFVVLDSGLLVTKDFAGSRPGHPIPPEARRPAELVVMEPERLEIVARCELDEPSIARLSAVGDEVFVVGETSLIRLRVDASSGTVTLPAGARVAYRTGAGQGYGWDCVIAAGAAWWLDDGEGSDRFAGSLLGLGLAEVPLHLVRQDLATGALVLAEICGRPGGLIANPPVVDEARSIAVGYDSGNGVVTAFDIGADGALERRWTRRQAHASHLVLSSETGELVTGDFDPSLGREDLVVLDLETGEETARVATGSPVQSVLFPACGFGDELYWCTLASISRIAFGARSA